MIQTEYQMPAILRKDAKPLPPARPPPPARRRLGRRWWWMGAAAAAVMVAGLFLLVRSPLGDLTEADLQAARRRWERGGIRDYDLTLRITVTGSEPSELLVRVREGLVRDLIRNGRPVSTSSPGDYSVDGLFETMSRELELKKRPGEAFGGSGGNLWLRVRFDENLGFVRKYVRVLSGTGHSSEIRLLAFEPLAPDRPAED